MESLELESRINDDLLPFPVTDFSDKNKLHSADYRKHLEWVIVFDATAIGLAGAQYSAGPRTVGDTCGCDESHGQSRSG